MDKLTRALDHTVLSPPPTLGRPLSPFQQQPSHENQLPATRPSHLPSCHPRIKPNAPSEAATHRNSFLPLSLIVLLSLQDLALSSTLVNMRSGTEACKNWFSAIGTYDVMR